MTTTFTASNGGTIETRTYGGLIIKNGTRTERVHPLTVETLREYFTAERDEQLGRWRDPEAPHMVVYPYSADEVWVLNEIDCASIHCRRDTFVQAAIEIGDEDTFPISDYDRAAARYFAAHPEPREWHDAQSGELWILTIDGEQVGALACRPTPVPTFETATGTLRHDDPDLTGGRRIWPRSDDE